MVFLRNNWIHFIFLCLNLKLSNCFGRFLLKNFDLSLCSGILMDRKCRKVLLVLIGPNFWNSFYQFHLRNFSTEESMDSFRIETDYTFQTILKFVLYIRIGILIGQKWQKCYQYKHISIFQLIFLENYSCECLSQCLIRRFHTFRWLLSSTISSLVPHIGILFF